MKRAAVESQHAVDSKWFFLPIVFAIAGVAAAIQFRLPRWASYCAGAGLFVLGSFLLGTLVSRDSLKHEAEKTSAEYNLADDYGLGKALAYFSLWLAELPERWSSSKRK